MAPRTVSRSRVIAAPPERIFDVLADPTQHGAIDGSGSVLEARDTARLTEGATFGIGMRIGVAYTMTNHVVAFEEGRCIAWRHFGHHVWRYDLTPVEGGTQVTETFDWTHARARAVYGLLGIPKKNLKSIEATLERLDALVTA